ncbi:MAG: hypothetical protein JWN34_614 [Bryobacterales bacterium]|nr:hypothetical protein [Bryobacterales bacterium]
MNGRGNDYGLLVSSEFGEVYASTVLTLPGLAATGSAFKFSGASHPCRVSAGALTFRPTEGQGIEAFLNVRH